MRDGDRLTRPTAGMLFVALLNLRMNRNKGSHPSPLPTSEEISLLAALSLGKGVGGKGNSSLHSATPYLFANP
jgi:hypothetical protein